MLKEPVFYKGDIVRVINKSGYVRSQFDDAYRLKDCDCFYLDVRWSNTYGEIIYQITFNRHWDGMKDFIMVKPLNIMLVNRPFKNKLKALLNIRK